MSKLPKLSLKSIVAASVLDAARGDDPGSRLDRRKAANLNARGTLKERAKQLSVYLEPCVHDQLRDIAYAERTKIHPLMLEALDLLFKQRGALSIQQLEMRSSRDA